MGAKEIESLKAGLAGAQSQPAPLIGGTWTGNTFEHFGQFVGTGLPGGAIPVTPGLLEFDRRRQVLAILAKVYMQCRCLTRSASG